MIRRRLQTKMEFLSESGAETLAPDDAALNAHLAVGTLAAFWVVERMAVFVA